MARPKHEQPTPGELEVLKILWDLGPATVREVHEALSADRPRAYTSVLSLLGVMAEKGLVHRRPKGRAFEYEAADQREATLSGMVGDLLSRAFEGSASLLVAQLLEQSQPNTTELDEIRRTLAAYRKQNERKHEGGGS